MHRPPGWKPVRRAPTDPHYLTLVHKAFREAVLRRDGYRCTAPNCPTLDRGHGGRLIADHIRPRRMGGSDDPSNGRTLCPTCDNRRHREKGLR